MPIIDLPTEAEFTSAGEAILNIAWTTIVELLKDLDEIKAAGKVLAEKEVEGYWRSAERPIATSMALIQQGVEFLIKGRISAVSPFLLLADSPSQWPKGSSQESRSFHEFRTIDAQDLIRVHQTAAQERFSDQFVTWFDTMRAQRNRIMHTVADSRKLLPVDVVISTLTAHEHLVGPRMWIRCRERHLELSPQHSISLWGEVPNSESAPYIRYQLLREFGLCLSFLTPAITNQFFGYTKRRPTFYCARCLDTLAAMEFFDNGHHAHYSEVLQTDSTCSKGTCVVCQHTYVGSGEMCGVCGKPCIDSNVPYCISCGQLQ